MARITGGRELRLKLEQIPKEVRTAVWAQLNRSADELMQLQRRLVPVDTGSLRNSIRKRQWPEARTATRGLKVSIIAGGIPGAGAAGTREVNKRGKVFDQAVMVEYGVKAHRAGGKFRGARIPAIPPRPYFFPPYRLSRRRIKGAISRSISTAIKKFAAR